MVYRVPCDPEAERARADAVELRHAVEGARRRRLRAALVVSVSVTGLMMIAALICLTAFTPRAPSGLRARCHHVTIRWEDAEHLPPEGWTTCAVSEESLW